MKILPLGIQSFRKLRENNAIYVDKTQLIHQLVTTGSIYFLARPRRFGKSLLVSTLKELYRGNKILFNGLWIENNWDWTRTYPVLSISFTKVDYQSANLGEAIAEYLDELAESFGITLKKKSFKLKFSELITNIYNNNQQKVVLLVDEYDKPIIDFLETNQLTKAKKNRDILKIFYSGLKDLDDCLQFVFITGVSKFSRISIFSDLNHLTDLTLVNDYATLLGYTQTELATNFEDYLKIAQKQYKISRKQLLDKIKKWYDGYSWDGQQHVYNPFGTLNFLFTRQFKNYWFSTGTPMFLFEQMKRQQQFEVEKIVVNDNFLEKYNLDNMEIIPLLFQAGYLTIIASYPDANLLTLDYPNKEVQESFYDFLLSEISPSPLTSQMGLTLPDLKNAFETHNLTRVRVIVDSMLADLPYQTFKDSSEGLYHGLMHILFSYLGTVMQSESHSSKGRSDIVVQTNTNIYIFEFKIKSSSQTAFQQIIDNNYADKYRASNKTIIGIGVNFDTKLRKSDPWIIEPL